MISPFSPYNSSQVHSSQIDSFVVCVYASMCVYGVINTIELLPTESIFVICECMTSGLSTCIG